MAIFAGIVRIISIASESRKLHCPRIQETVAGKPTNAFSASDIRRPMQHPDSHQRGRLSQI